MFFSTFWLKKEGSLSVITTTYVDLMVRAAKAIFLNEFAESACLFDAAGFVTTISPRNNIWHVHAIKLWVVKR